MIKCLTPEETRQETRVYQVNSNDICRTSSEQIVQIDMWEFGVAQCPTSLLARINGCVAVSNCLLHLPVENPFPDASFPKTSSGFQMKLNTLTYIMQQFLRKALISNQDASRNEVLIIAGESPHEDYDERDELIEDEEYIRYAVEKGNLNYIALIRHMARCLLHQGIAARMYLNNMPKYVNLSTKDRCLNVANTYDPEKIYLTKKW